MSGGRPPAATARSGAGWSRRSRRRTPSRAAPSRSRLSGTRTGSGASPVKSPPPALTACWTTAGWRDDPLLDRRAEPGASRRWHRRIAAPPPAAGRAAEPERGAGRQAQPPVDDLQCQPGGVVARLQRRHRRADQPGHRPPSPASPAAARRGPVVAARTAASAAAKVGGDERRRRQRGPGRSAPAAPRTAHPRCSSPARVEGVGERADGVVRRLDPGRAAGDAGDVGAHHSPGRSTRSQSRDRAAAAGTPSSSRAGPGRRR